MIFLYFFPLLVGALGVFFIRERQQIIQLLPELTARSLFYLGICYVILGGIGIGILHFMGEETFIIWVISILLLTTILPITALLFKK